jgi:hypothetical protein
MIVEAVEDNFVPVAIYNNVGGEDKKILTRFGEPAWNYHVMRFMDSKAHDIVPRRDRVWTLPDTASRLAEALRAAEKPVPAYLTNILIPESNSRQKTAVLAMHCFWTGEAKLGALDGVLTTEAGFYEHREVVRVCYNSEKLSLRRLITEAEKMECANGVYLADAQDREVAEAIARNPVNAFDKLNYRAAPASDQKRQLRSDSRWSELNLTPMQWTKVNAAVGYGRVQDLPLWLTPRQQKQIAP